MPEVIPKSKRLKLADRSHTGHRLHKSHTSYPLLAAMLLMMGVLLTTMTLQVRAASVTVTAVANGPAPVLPAVILSPENGDHFTDSSVPVSGTCPAGYYIKLFRNDIFSGSALCTDGGTFSITTDLFAGRNDLQARIFNVADNEGPRSSVVTVYYDIPGTEEPGTPAVPGTYQPSGLPDAQSPFYISSEYFFKAAYTGQRITWDFDIMGGKGPYTGYMVWGDGYSDMTREIESNSFTVEHSYNSLKDKREYFSVTVRVQDAEGHRASLQLVAIMNDPNVIGGALVRPNNTPFSPDALFSGMLKFVWSAYGIVLMMGICFWLGERRGFSIRDSLYRRRHHA